MKLILSVGGRDPVCEAIESLLQRFEAKGLGTLKSGDVDGICHLSFGEIRSEAPTRDIALIRLAVTMMDDPRYCTDLHGALRQPMADSAND